MKCSCQHHVPSTLYPSFIILPISAHRKKWCFDDGGAFVPTELAVSVVAGYALFAAGDEEAVLVREDLQALLGPGTRLTRLMLVVFFGVEAVELRVDAERVVALC